MEFLLFGLKMERLKTILKLRNARKQACFLRMQQLYDTSKTCLDQEDSLRNFLGQFNTIADTRKEFMSSIDEVNDLELQIDPEFEPNYKAVAAFDDLYGNVLLTLEDPRVIAFRQLFTGAKPSHTEHSPRVRLPEVKLPSFSGNLSDWPNFYESFKNMIHKNNDLSDTDKINYLIGLLSGKAASIAIGLPVIGSNYDILWNRLIQRFQNSRALAVLYLEKILELKPMITASANGFII